MDTLPDDELIAVLSYVDLKGLFACRLVCRRLAGLALHPDVWRDRACDTTAGVKPCSVLRLAPCLSKLVVSLPWRCCASLLASTPCPVEELSLGQDAPPKAEDVDLNSYYEKCYKAYCDTYSSARKQAAWLLARQVELGRLRYLSVSMIGLSEAVAATPGLRGLEIFVNDIGLYSLCSCPPPKPSLKYFRCAINKQSESFCNFVLGAHAATLKAVDLSTPSDIEALLWILSLHVSAVAPLLANMPNLSRLRCPLMPGLEKLADIGTLQTVEFTVYPNSDSVGQLSAATFLRRARHLRSVRLAFICGDTAVHQDLVRSLASSHIESLFIRDECGDQLQGLLTILPSLASLQHLELAPWRSWQSKLGQYHPVDLLERITPASAPALRSIKFSFKYARYRILQIQDGKVQEECLNTWLHHDTFLRALSANPRLHIQVDPPFKPCKDTHCGACGMLPNREAASAGKKKYTGIYSHGDDENCTEDHRNGVHAWIRIH